MKNSNNYRNLNFAANILVVLVCATLVGLFSYRAFFQSPLSSLEAELLKSGTEFKGLQEIDFGKTPNTILLAADINCQFCTQSLPFYKKLAAASRENPAVRVVGVFKNKEEEVRQYLREHNVELDFISNVDLVKVRVDTTPTVIWVDANRKISGSYEGLLREDQETAFFEFYNKRLAGK